MKQNIILADCCPEEVATFAHGCMEQSQLQFETLSSISNGSHSTAWQNMARYAAYFLYPFKVFFHRKQYGVILGWQQFYAINYALYCRLFHVKKTNTLVAVNFTYKRKSGLVGKLYHSYMKYACNNQYLDYLHVLSLNYVNICVQDLGIPTEKFIVTGFGVPDTYDEMKNRKAPMQDFSLSIGRSNRDFEFLVKVWSQPCLKDRQLVIASDTWKPTSVLPSNIIHRDDIKYDDSFAWFNSCNLCITPIEDGNICSGDTVLLTGMMFSKPSVVTTPSTLAEMYVCHQENGLCIPKDVEKAAQMIAELLANKEQMATLGAKARKSYLDNFSRESMGKALVKAMNI